jgi:hypothetical protein
LATGQQFWEANLEWDACPQAESLASLYMSVFVCSLK